MNPIDFRNNNNNNIANNNNNINNNSNIRDVPNSPMDTDNTRPRLSDVIKIGLSCLFFISITIFLIFIIPLCVCLSHHRINAHVQIEQNSFCSIEYAFQATTHHTTPQSINQTRHFIHRFLKYALRLLTSSANAFFGSLSPNVACTVGSNTRKNGFTSFSSCRQVGVPGLFFAFSSVRFTAQCRFLISRFDGSIVLPNFSICSAFSWPWKRHVSSG